MHTKGSGREEKMCNPYYAAYVKLNPPIASVETLSVDVLYMALCPVIYLFIKEIRPMKNTLPDPIFCLHINDYRRIYIYIPKGGDPDGQTRKTRPEGRGAETRQYAASPPRRRGRPTLPEKSIFRYSGSSAGSLRDATAAPDRRGVDPECSGSFWGLATHFLSTADGVRSSRSRRPAAETARAQGRAQSLHRGSRLRHQLKDGRAGTDDPAVRPGHQRSLRHHHSPAQSRAGSVAQQKKNSPTKRSLGVA